MWLDHSKLIGRAQFTSPKAAKGHWSEVSEESRVRRVTGLGFSLFRVRVTVTVTVTVRVRVRVRVSACSDCLTESLLTSIM